MLQIALFRHVCLVQLYSTSTGLVLLFKDNIILFLLQSTSSVNAYKASKKREIYCNLQAAEKTEKSTNVYFGDFMTLTKKLKIVQQMQLLEG